MNPDRLPRLIVTPDRYLPYRYAGAAEDFNPIHVDAEFARSVGFSGNVLHGLYGMALVARQLIATAGQGDPRALQRLSVEFRATGVPEEPIVIDAKVLSADDDQLVLAAEAFQGDAPLIRRGEAVVRRT